jgi:D-3-phosphoglycerate dehydrogenase / 2-oxoglutarate reductase
VTAVAVTPRSFRNTPGPHLVRLRETPHVVRFPELDRPLDEAEMLEFVRGCEGLIVGVDPVTEPVLEAGPLRVVVKYGSGLDNIDLVAAQRLGVHVSSTAGANARSVAELAFALLLAVARHVVAHDRRVRAGSWSRLVGVELGGKRLGLIGYGAIGRELAQLARGFGMDVVAYDALVVEADVELVSLEELLRSSDAVSLHLPLDEGTRGLIGAAELALMRPGAFLVNTARGGLVDEDALAAALHEGRLGGAAFDAFAEEPVPLDSPLLLLEGFVASPHAGAATVEAARRASLQAVDLLLREL